MKRGIMEKDKFRFTIAGKDVDSAQDYDFVLHEEHLAAQAYYMKSIPCPVQDISDSARTVSVNNVITPPRSDTTAILHYLRSSNSGGFYPFPPSDGSTGTPTAPFYYFEIINSTTMNVWFDIPANSPPPIDLFIVYMRGVA